MAIKLHKLQLRTLKNYRHFNKVTAGIGITLFAVVGTILLFNTRAAGPFASIEPEQGTKTPAATVGSDTAASGGQYVQFGSASQSTILSNFFPIGVYVPPASDFAKWKSRGVNTMVDVPQGNDLEAWNAEANRLGLHMIRRPRPNPADDKTESLLLAWAHPDEPDGIYQQVPYTTIQANYNSWKSIDPSRLAYINFIGDLNQYDVKTNEGGDAWYSKYAAGADWISADKYPVNAGNTTNFGVLGQMVDHLKVLAGTKPVFAYIESGDFNSSDASRALTPDELRGEIWEVIIHGARGIWYFPEQVTPSFIFDVTPADVAVEMTKQDNLITSLTNVLQGPINPSGISVAVSAPLETAWRSDASGKYAIVLNLSSATQTGKQITLNGFGSATSATVYNESRNVNISGGVITDNFTPYTVHIYKVP